jgi:hypothetical protein
MAGEIPRGIEVLIKKASVDPTFKTVLLAKREEAADAIGLRLSPSEITMLRGTPTDQLSIMIRQTRVRSDLRPVFRGAAAALMLAALSASGGAQAEESPPTPKPTHTTKTTKPTDKAFLKKRLIRKVMPPRTEFVAVAGVLPPGWNEPHREWVEFPPESTPELDKLKDEEVKARVEKLLPQLADEVFEVREQATLKLMQLGQRIVPLIADLKLSDLEAATRLARVRTVLATAKQAEGKLKRVDGKWEWHVKREPLK